jgi:phosphoglycolate phosphatase-like HAD superfamily hydrolase
MNGLPLLPLFDVDGTLILSGRAGIRGLNAAFELLFGRAGALEGVAFAGRTDKAIVADGLRRLDVAPTDDAIDEVRAAYLEVLQREIDRPAASPAGVLPGVDAILGALETRGVRVGLLTGNFEGGAAIKLGHFGLWTRFAFGAFGDRHLDRRDLLPVAFDRARRAGVDVPAPERVVVIGDTPLDIECARAHRVRAVGVATGPFDAAALRAAGADLVVETLIGTEAILEWMEGL